MPNNVSQAVPYTINIVGIVSATTAVVSAFLSFLSYKKSSAQFESNQRNNFINLSKEKLDKCYMDLSEFIQTFTGSRETKEKRIVRERIVFSLETLRVDFSTCVPTNSHIDMLFGGISLKISDITYEKNFEKNMRDIAIIKDNISDLKNRLISLNR